MRLFFLLIVVLTLGSSISANAIPGYPGHKVSKNALLSGDSSLKQAQDKALSEVRQTEKEVKKELFFDQYHRQTPRSSVENFLNAARKSDFERAINYLDFSGVNKKIRQIAPQEVAQTLKLVLDRSLWIDLPTLSDEVTGFIDDGQVENRDLLGFIPLQDKQVPIYVQRMQRADSSSEMVWKIAGSSINYLPDLYLQYGDGPVGEVLTQFLPNKSFLGLLIWQWLTLLIMVIGAALFAWLPTKLIAWLIEKRHFNLGQQMISIIVGPVRFLVFVLLLRAWCPLLSLSLEARQITQGYTFLIIAFTWALLSTISILRDYFVDWLTTENKKSAAKLIRPLTNMVKIVVVITAILVWLENLGFQASSIIAGLGIGGLAFALASQKSIENLIAGITLYVSSPVKVGNLCRVGKHLGFIEEIGLRYTRVRTLDRTLVNISNAIFADMELENYSERNRIRYKPQLVLSYKASPEQIKNVIQDIKKLLDEHEDVCEKPCRVRLADYVEYGITVNVLSYVNTTKFPKYAEVSNELNLKILDILSKHDVELADLSKGAWKSEAGQSLDEL